MSVTICRWILLCVCFTEVFLEEAKNVFESEQVGSESFKGSSEEGHKIDIQPSNMTKVFSSGIDKSKSDELLSGESKAEESGDGKSSEDEEASGSGSGSSIDVIGVRSSFGNSEDDPKAFGKLRCKSYRSNTDTRWIDYSITERCDGNYFCNDMSDEKNCAYKCTATPYKKLRKSRSFADCRAAFRRWYFDFETKRCRSFIYGGCALVKNLFQSKKECLSECGQWQKSSRAGEIIRSAGLVRVNI